MSTSRTSEAARDIGGKTLIVVGIVGGLLIILLGAVQIELVSTNGDFALCGSVWRPLSVQPAAAATACADALGLNVLGVAITAGVALAALIGGIALRATVPKRLRHRR